MIKIFILLLLIPLLFIHSIAPVEVLQTPENTKVEVKQLDRRAEVLQAYLAKHNSPLQYHAQDFIDASDTYNLDWKLVPAIAGVESTFGKHIPGGYNGWGWGVYGDQALGFASWRDGIFTVSKGLRENYIDDGLTDPISMNRRYAASPTWGVKVNFFLRELEKHSNLYSSEGTLPLETMDIASKTAGTSAELKSI